MGSFITSRAIANMLRGFDCGSSLKPNCFCFSAASASDRPFAVLMSKSSASNIPHET